MNLSLFAFLSFAAMRCSFAATPFSRCEKVFVNEIHYDNVGTDVGEFIEITGPAGTDLSEFSIVLYNGSTRQVYDSMSLSGILADNSAGFGFSDFSYPTNGFQNGAPDGLALVDGDGNVVQFLSYEGSFTASGGPANGLTSTDIGVFEPGSTPVGESLQLTGMGSCADGFTWTGPDLDSPGTINFGQKFVCTTTFINEIHYDNVGTDVGEFIEIASPVGTDLSGFSLVLYNGATGKTYDTTPLSGVVTDQSNGVGFLTFPYATNGIQNGAPDGVALVDPSGNVVQFLSYEGDFTANGGPADGLASTDIGVSELGSTPVGFSLQLGGEGNCAEDFVWFIPSNETPGAQNQPQTIVRSAQESDSPSLRPSAKPSHSPSLQPSVQPSHSPSLQPSVPPSQSPTFQPSAVPSGLPSSNPSAPPTPPIAVTCIDDEFLCESSSSKKVAKSSNKSSKASGSPQFQVCLSAKAAKVSCQTADQILQDEDKVLNCGLCDTIEV